MTAVNELLGPKGMPLPPHEVDGLRLLGAQLRAARFGRGWSQRRLEWASGVDQTTISRLENGRLRSLRLTRIGDLIAALRGDWQIFPGETSPDDAKNGIIRRDA